MTEITIALCVVVTFLIYMVIHLQFIVDKILRDLNKMEDKS